MRIFFSPQNAMLLIVLAESNASYSSLFCDSFVSCNITR